MLDFQPIKSILKGTTMLYRSALQVMFTKPTRVRYFRAKWSTWKETSNSHLTFEGIEELEFDYDEDPLGDYGVDHGDLPFEISSYDSRLRTKATVLGVVIEGEAFAFRFEDF